MSAHQPFDERFARSLPATGRAPIAGPRSVLGLKALLGGDRRVTGTPFDAPLTA